MPTEIIPGLNTVADRYDAVLCDVWGVLHNGEVSFADASDALSRFQSARGPVVLISNAGRPQWAVTPQLAALGVPASAYSALVTSGDVTRVAIEAKASAPAWHIGPDRDTPLFEGLPVTLAQRPQDAAYVICTGLRDDEAETPEDYRAELESLAGRPFICANPDRIVQRGDRLIYCSGALADIYATLGGEIIMAGKPYAPIYEAAYETLGRLMGRRPAPERILAIGDGLPTDVLGARSAGLDCLFVTSGIHAADTMDEAGAVVATKLDAFLAANDAQARYAMADLAWGV